MEGAQSYQAPKTPKMFITTMQSSFNKREGDKMARQLRQLYNSQSYKTIPTKNWNVNINATSFNDGQTAAGGSFARMLEFVRDYSMERAAGRWSECFEKHMQTLIALLKVLEDMKQMKVWLARPLLVVIRATKKIFLTCEAKVSNSSLAAKLKTSLFNTLQRFKIAKALDDIIKRQFLSLVDVMQVSILLFFHNYEQLQRIIYSSKIYGQISNRYIDNFLFQKGKYALINQNFLQAEQCFLKINLRTKGQKKLVMRYLIPCRIFLGRLYQGPEQDYYEYSAIIKAIKEADFKSYDQQNKKYQKLWLKRGIYLLMDRIRIIVWRTLLKRLYHVGSIQLDLELIEKGVKVHGGSQSLEECFCIVANLIYEGYVKGYIFQNEAKRTLVLKKSGNPFPKLDSIATK